MEISRTYYLNQLISVMHNGMIKIVIGVRRCGKSYLLFHIFRDWLAAQGIDDQHIIAIETQKEQEYFSLRHIDDSFAKYVIAGQGAFTSITQDGIHVVDLFDFLLDENSI